VLSQQEISDRLEIQDLLINYSHALDFRQWDEFDHIFTPDAVIDYTEMGGPRGDLVSTKAYLAKAMQLMATYQHMVATSKVTITGDTATGRTICHNPMTLIEGNQLFWCGLWYRDEFVRTEEGWRIKDRYEERCYMHGLDRPPVIPE
jgi:hypothetical protein